MGALHKVPLGLLGALSLKTHGRNPIDFGETVFGMVDLLDHYLTDLADVFQAGANLLATFSSVAITVPAGMVYRVHSVGISLTPNAADVALRNDGAFLVRRAQGALNAGIMRGVQMPAVAAVGASVFDGMIFDRPLVLPPGAQIFWQNTRAYSANCSAVLTSYLEAIPV